MKKLTLGLFLIIVFTMCKKETQIIYETPAPTLAGEWYGLYGTALNKVPTMPYYFMIRSTNTMKISAYDTSTIFTADTACKVSGDTVKATYIYRYKNGTAAETYSIAARFLSNFSFMSGTWGYGGNAYNGGSFFMGRK